MRIAKSKLTLTCIFIISLVLVGQSFGEIDPETIFGIWLFDEDNGDTAKDSSDNKNHGEFIKNPEWVEGKFGSALAFDGTNGVEITNPDQFEFLTWTYTFWFRVAPGGDYPNLIGRQFANAHGWTIHLDPAGATFRIRIDSDGGINQVKTTPKAVRDEEWHHGALTHDDEEKKLQLYIDGVKGDSTYAGEYKNTGGFLRIGAAAVGAVNLTGEIDEVGIFTAILEEEDIIDIMEKGLAEVANLLPVSPAGTLVSTWGRIKK